MKRVLLRCQPSGWSVSSYTCVCTCIRLMQSVRERLGTVRYGIEGKLCGDKRRGTTPNDQPSARQRHDRDDGSRATHGLPLVLLCALSRAALCAWRKEVCFSGIGALGRCATRNARSSEAGWRCAGRANAQRFRRRVVEEEEENDDVEER